MEARTVTALDAITAFAVPNPNCSSQESVGFFGSGRSSGYPSERITQPTFGSATFYFRQPFQPSTAATLNSCFMSVNAPFQCRAWAANALELRMQAIELLMLSEWVAGLLPLFHRSIHSASKSKKPRTGRK
jgi:hypothetical protein